MRSMLINKTTKLANIIVSVCARAQCIHTVLTSMNKIKFLTNEAIFTAQGHREASKVQVPEGVTHTILEDSI